MSSPIADLFVVITGQIGELAAAMDACGAAGEACAEKFTASLDAAEAACAGFAEKVTASMREAGASADEAALQMASAFGGMDAARAGAATSAEAASTAEVTMSDAEKAAADAARAESVALRELIVSVAETTAAVDEASAAVDIEMASMKKAAGAEDALIAKNKESAASAAKFGSAMKTALLGVGIAVVYGVDQAMKFQTQVTRLYTAAGLTGASIKTVSQDLLQLGDQTGYTGTQLAEAMYHPVSAGLSLAQSLKVVANAADLANIHGASLEDTTYALSSVMKAYNVSAGNVTKTSALLNAIVGQGDMRFEDFNQSIKNWTPTGAAMGISIQSMGSALAYLTDRGNSAEVASTRMTMGLSMVTSGSKAANGYLKDLGLTTGKLSLQNKSLQSTMLAAGLTTNKVAADLKKPDGIYVALNDIQTAFRKSGLSASQADQVMAKIFGG